MDQPAKQLVRQTLTRIDYFIFTNIDKLAKRLNPTSLVISEVVFGILLMAVAVQLAVSGLGSLGIIAPSTAH